MERRWLKTQPTAVHLGSGSEKGPSCGLPTVLCTRFLPGVDDGFFWLSLDCGWEKPTGRGNSKRIVTFFFKCLNFSFFSCPCK